MLKSIHLCLGLLIIFLAKSTADSTKVVSIHFDGEHICTGIMQSLMHVVATASCVCTDEIKGRLAKLNVHLGSNLKRPEQELMVQFLDCHQRFVKFEPFGAYNDIAVLRLFEKPFMKYSYLVPVKYANKPKSPCHIYLWKQNTLHAVGNIEIELDLDQCEKLMKTEKLNKNQLCTRKVPFVVRDIDRGAPLICQNKFAGLFSWKYPFLVKEGIPYIYTNLYAHRLYIDEAKLRFKKLEENLDTHN